MRVSIFQASRMFRECLEDVMSAAGFHVTGSYGSPRELFDSLPTHRPDVALADLTCGQKPWDESDARLFLRQVRDSYPAVAVVVLGCAMVPDADACYREGAAAYV